MRRIFCALVPVSKNRKPGSQEFLPTTKQAGNIHAAQELHPSATPNRHADRWNNRYSRRQNDYSIENIDYSKGNRLADRWNGLAAAWNSPAAIWNYLPAPCQKASALWNKGNSQHQKTTEDLLIKGLTSPKIA